MKDFIIGSIISSVMVAVLHPDNSVGIKFAILALAAVIAVGQAGL